MSKKVREEMHAKMNEFIRQEILPAIDNDDEPCEASAWYASAFLERAAVLLGSAVAGSSGDLNLAKLATETAMSRAEEAFCDALTVAGGVWRERN